MKKSKFVNGMGAIFASALVFMTGSLLTSCENEDLNATFQTSPAEVTLNVTVMDALTGTDITSQATITVTGALTATGMTSFPAGYKGGEVTVTAAYDGMTGKATIGTDAKKVGGKVTYSANVILSSVYTFAVKSKNDVNLVTKPLGDQTHAHGGSNWCLNDNEYLLTRSFEYMAYNEQEATTTYEPLDVLAANMTYNKSKKEEVTYTFSAWAYYRVTYKGVVTTTVYNVIRKGGNDVVGTFTTVANNNYSIEPEEAAFNAHYVHGHGHGTHGYGDNAGGGLIEAE